MFFSAAGKIQFDDHMKGQDKRRAIMQVRDVMSPDVYVIRPDATLQEAAQQMKASHVGSLLVHGGEVAIGILTEHDITMRAVAEGRDPTTTKVRDIMTPEIIWCHEDADVTSAINLMKEKQIRHLAVGDEHQNLVGIVSLYALALRTGDETLAGTAIRWPA
jgi:predicted transcriptional regulator